jgi:hypothetical protein
MGLKDRFLTYVAMGTIPATKGKDVRPRNLLHRSHLEGKEGGVISFADSTKSHQP